MGSNQGGKVRIVARIRGDLNTSNADNLDGVSISNPWISVLRPDPVSNSNLRSNRVKISFGSDPNSTSSGKQCYEVDECYEQNVGTEEVFSKEIKPLISGLFGGQNSTVFAYGPQGSGKTYTIQGCEEQFGLTALTVDAILPRAEEAGKIVTVSVFEVYQDRVSDLLDAKRPEVSVFEDGQGKIRLKGLSKVKVNTTSDFQKLYLQATNARKPSRSHVGCIIYVVSPQTEKSNAQLLGKMNFIDLASYEDSRRKSNDGSNLIEATRINKSLYAVHNVLYALNAKETRVPFRECKLTRMLQDSLGGKSRILMVTCMNPFHCQETVQTISLASRSCMAGFLACLDPGKSSSRSGSKTIEKSSPQVLKSASKFNVRSSMMSPKVVKPMSASASGRKIAGSQLGMSMKKAKVKTIEEKGRKLFDDANPSKKLELGYICPESASTMESSAHREASLSQAPSFPTQQEEKSASNTSLDMESSQHPSEEEMQTLQNSSITSTTPFAYKTPTEHLLIEDKENKSFVLNVGQSPPLSARIRELSNSLKSLCVSTEANLKIAQNSSNLIDQVVHEKSEPETPNLPILGAEDKHVIHEKSEFKTPSARLSDKHEIANLTSPWENFHMRGSGMKDSLVQEYLKFLNTASKEELKGLKGIGEKRATYILEMRDESPEPFKQLDDLKEIGLSAKQIKGMMRNVAGELF
ncbi:unnamed protein product [Amaranthus hypochondriacus]